MGLSTITPEGEIRVPMQGSPSPEVLARLEFLESTAASLQQEINELKGSIAGESYGLVKLSDRTDITDTSGIALSARQNNPAIEGTIRNCLEKITNRLNIKMINREVQFNNGKAFVQIEDSTVGRLCMTQICGGNGANYSVHLSYPDGDGRIYIILTASVTAVLSVCILYATK